MGSIASTGPRPWRRAAAVAGAAAALAGASPAAAVPVSPDHVAHRAASRKVRFAVIGDFGWGGGAQWSLARRMCRWRRSYPFGLVVTTGDNVYPDGAPWRFRRKFLRPYRCLRSRGVRFRATLGNHDYLTRAGRPELRTPAFGMSGRNYVFDRGAVRFVMADSNALNRRWLARAAWPRGHRWTIVLFHHPVLSPGPHGSTPSFRPGLPRMFRRRGVDLVLNGHDHLYSVSKPRRRIRYVVTGGGGAPLYDCLPRGFTARCRERHHFLVVVATRARLRVRAVPIRGAPFGRFSTRGRAPAGRSEAQETATHIRPP